MAPHAVSALVVENLELVPKLARKLQLSPRSSVWDDAIQAGRLALIQAASLYDENAGTSFRVYAPKFVLNAIKKALTAEHLVRSARYKGAPTSDIDAVYAQHNVPSALVDRDVEGRQVEALDMGRRRIALRGAIRALPLEQRIALRSVHAGSTVTECASAQGVCIRKIKYALSEGRAELGAPFYEN